MSSPIEQALDLLRAGELVGIPTETVYGLAADAANPAAVARIFALKGRPADHPVIIHIAGAAQLQDWAKDIPAAAWQLAEAFWPGPLTLILPRQPHVPDAVTGGQDTVGLRAPSHPVTQELLQRFGGGLAAPSANQFGHVSPTTAQHVADEFGARLRLVLDGGPCLVGVESTIVSLIGERPKLLRPGGVPREAIEAVLGQELEHHTKAKSAGIRTSGLLDSHYAPRTRLITGSFEQLLAEAASREQAGEKVVLLHHQNWSDALPAQPHHQLPGDPVGYARTLYATLREFDTQGFDTLLLEATPAQAAWLAVQDRVSRAAHGRLEN
ncbi:L-threonylcarbamoyladenylate synthase [Andreprevotia lacus DSM 23236]|jgi:L-threonylcarbamoyladenylate synthase|uniref:Threonylcarbamoyl-AMP synthase n=1 Tax=Andreprevotia lacus DSM 23236 TaxID=1121001 RepID=A0A1W1XDY1_9NEIS|nr:L-threonylcarbamoyladenylate synthase [Andreprevotia lacus]SMC21858.1 L-threonylcarbamoyladenylate synthase [Andreprevotia lacus DSM 23236]